MKIIKNFIALTISVLVLASCASNKIHIKVKIYRGDTPVGKEWKPEDLAKIVSTADELNSAGSKLAADKLSLAEAMNKAYNCYYRTFAGLTDADLGPNNNLYKGYTDEIRIHRRMLEFGFNSVIKITSELKNPSREKSGMPARLEMQDSISTFLVAMKSNVYALVSLPVFGEFEKVEYESIGDVIRSARMLSDRVPPDSLNKNCNVIELLVALKRSVDSIQFVINPAKERLSESLGQITNGLITKTKSDLGPAVSTALVNLQKLKESYSDKSAVPQLSRVQSLVQSEHQRLQDLSDPVWKIIATDGHKWRKWRKFSKTFFRAEGNSSVVIVKDDPTVFRIQQGSNNPAALVQAQMKIVRATADAGLKIASAYIGIPVSTGANNSTDSTATAAPKQPDAVVVALSNERRDELKDEVNDILADVSKDKPDHDELTSQLKAMLKSYQLKFKK